MDHSSSSSRLPLLADHEIAAPSAPIVLGVSDVATVEVQLFLTEDA